MLAFLKCFRNEFTSYPAGITKTYKNYNDKAPSSQAPLCLGKYFPSNCWVNNTKLILFRWCSSIHLFNNHRIHQYARIGVVFSSHVNISWFWLQIAWHFGPSCSSYVSFVAKSNLGIMLHFVCSIFWLFVNDAFVRFVVCCWLSHFFTAHHLHTKTHTCNLMWFIHTLWLFRLFVFFSSRKKPSLFLLKMFACKPLKWWRCCLFTSSNVLTSFAHYKNFVF